MDVDITLSSTQRTTLRALQLTQRLSDRTQSRLASGLKVTSVSDDAFSYFRSRSLSQRAADFEERRSDIDQAVSSVGSALTAIESIEDLLQQMRGLAETGRSQSAQEFKLAVYQFRAVGTQLINLMNDASYQGLNLLNSTKSTLRVIFGTESTSVFAIHGYSLLQTKTPVSPYSIFTVIAGVVGPTNIFEIKFLSGKISQVRTSTTASNTVLGTLEKSVQRLRGFATQLGSNAAILKTRLQFTATYINDLKNGSEKLTVADINEEGAKLSVLQTRAQLGISALGIAAKEEQLILRLVQG